MATSWASDARLITPVTLASHPLLHDGGRAPCARARVLDPAKAASAFSAAFLRSSALPSARGTCPTESATRRRPRTLPVQMFGGPLRLAWRDRSLQLQRAAILGAVIDPKKVARETLSRASRRKLPASANRLSSSYGKQAIEVTRRCRQLWKRRENSGRRRRTPGSHCTACTLRPSVELTASLRQWPVWRLSTARQIEWGSSCRHLFGWGLSALRHPTAENFRKGGVHEVGTVVLPSAPSSACQYYLTYGP